MPPEEPLNKPLLINNRVSERVFVTVGEKPKKKSIVQINLFLKITNVHGSSVSDLLEEYLTESCSDIRNPSRINHTELFA